MSTTWSGGFALLLSAVASCAFGLAPAWFAANDKLQTGLREGGARSGEPGGRRRARSFLAAGEIALAMVLLVAAGLLLRSFAKLLSVSPGFDVQHLLKADISLPRLRPPEMPLSNRDQSVEAFVLDRSRAGACNVAGEILSAYSWHTTSV